MQAPQDSPTLDVRPLLWRLLGALVALFAVAGAVGWVLREQVEGWGTTFVQDYGVVGVQDPQGGPEIVGYMRGLDYGTMYWVAGVGPVRVTYRSGMSIGDDGVDAGLREITVTLTSASALD